MKFSIAALLLISCVPVLFAQDIVSPGAETITVTATRTETRLADTPASVVVLDREVLETSAGTATDEILRQVPGFTLFRRTSSRVANPTSQGVSLRGIGASGASRAVVLDDGIPLNDPFGGWVYWARAPRIALQRVEVLRGGASDLYGSGATGGVIQFIRRRESAPAVAVDVTAGTMGTRNGSLFGSAMWKEWSADVSVDLFSTDGYVLVEPSQRGPVDREADSRHATRDLTLRRGSAFVRGSRFTEERNNGTVMQVNDTSVTQLAAGSELRAGTGLLQLRTYALNQDYYQTFSAIAGDRATERLTVEQEVPSHATGGTLQWSQPVGSRHALLAGVEIRNVRGTSDELQYAFNGTTSRTTSRGQQRAVSAFVEDVIAMTPAFSMTAGVRYDSWRNHDASRNSLALPDRSESAWSPRLAALFRVNDALSLTASAYRAFRAPTLNELYRGFRVGNVLTQPNELLAAEKVSGFEAGVRYRGTRLTLFDMRTVDAVANVTLSVTPALITRQRQSTGESRSRGLELEAEKRLGRWRVSGGYLLTDARMTAGTLDGRRIPQVPRHQATLQTAFSGPIDVAFMGRWSSRQFDDDMNQLALRSAIVFDAFISRAVTGTLDVTLAAENVFDRRIEASATPAITVGTPRAITAGVRYRM